MTAQELRHIREQLGPAMTQQRFATLLGYTADHLRHMESGNRGIPAHVAAHVRRLARELQHTDVERAGS